jgi:hypothetical protein
MYLANVDCVGCHLEKKAAPGEVSGATTLVGSEKGCTNCHGPGYLGVLPEAQRLVDGTAEAIRKKLTSVNEALAGIPQGQEALAQVRGEVADAAHNLTFIERSHSVHNIYYAAHVLREADKALSKAAREVKLKVEKTSELPVISGAFCATLCHQKLGVKVPPEHVTYKGKKMPHKAHVEEGLACVSCHTFGVHKDVKLTGTNRCQTCHEETEKEKED